jgi:hypothetical protein
VIFGNNKPFEGETRERVTFAWLPLSLDDGRWVWLQRVRVFEEAKQDWWPGMGYRPLNPAQRGVWCIKTVELP